MRDKTSRIPDADVTWKTALPPGLMVVFGALLIAYSSPGVVTNTSPLSSSSRYASFDTRQDSAPHYKNRQHASTSSLVDMSAEMEAISDDDFLAFDTTASLSGAQSTVGDVAFFYKRADGTGQGLATPWRSLPLADNELSERILRVARNTDYTIQLRYRESDSVSDSQTTVVETVETSSSSTACAAIIAPLILGEREVTFEGVIGMAFINAGFSTATDSNPLAFYDDLGDIVWCAEVDKTQSAAPTLSWTQMDTGDFAFLSENEDEAYTISYLDGSVTSVVTSFMIYRTLSEDEAGTSYEAECGIGNYQVTHEMVVSNDGSGNLYTLVHYETDSFTLLDKYNPSAAMELRDSDHADDVLAMEAVLEWDAVTGEVTVLSQIQTAEIFSELTENCLDGEDEGDSTCMGGSGAAIFDWTHLNSLQPSTESDSNKWLMHDRLRSDLVLFDITTGEVDWHLSATDDSVSDFVFLTDDARWSGGHHVTQLENGDILVLDNRGCDDENTFWEGDYSRAICLHLDTEAMTVDLVWEYSGSNNPTTPYGTVHGSVYPVEINDSEHFLATFSDPNTLTADVVVLDAEGVQLKTFSWQSPAYRATPMTVGTFGERALAM